MKIDTDQLKITSSDLSPRCAEVIGQLTSATTTTEFVQKISYMDEWQSVMGKTEMARWATVLDRCDELLAIAVEATPEGHLRADVDATAAENVVKVLRFTAHLFENTYSRSLYSSLDRIIILLDSANMEIVTEALRLLQVISKRSRFLSQKTQAEQQRILVHKLTAIAQCWGGKLRSLKMEECTGAVIQLPQLFPFTVTTAHGTSVTVTRPPDRESLLNIVNMITATGDWEVSDKATLLARLRMLRHLEDQTHRIYCLISRLVAISTLIYSRWQPDETQLNTLLFPGLIEESTAVLKVESSRHPLIDALKAEALRTLTSIVSLEKPSRVQTLIDCLGATSYHGFLAELTRACVDDLRSGQLGKQGHASISLCTALFSLLYHLSGMESGGEALVSCGLTQTLLAVVAHHELPVDQVSFVTRCVRVIDIVTGIDVNGFQACDGMTVCIDRLVHEINECRKEQPFVIESPSGAGTSSAAVEAEDNGASTNSPPPKGDTWERAPRPLQPCHQQRSALIKSLLNFIKRTIQDTHFTEYVRHLMDGALPEALIHVLSNADYYSASLFHNALQLVTNFIFQEPTQLTALQDRHVPYVILQALLRKEIPNSRDVINSMATTFTALCLNERGLAQFKAYRPFEHVFRVILSVKFVTAMKRKRNEPRMSDEAAAIVGTAFDDLLRHQPTLRKHMLDAIKNALEKLLEIGNLETPPYRITMTLSKAAKGAAPSLSHTNSPLREYVMVDPRGTRRRVLELASPRDEDAESDEDDEMNGGQEPGSSRPDLGLTMEAISPDGERIMPLGEYLTIMTKIIETMITQNTTPDLSEGLVSRDCVKQLLGLLSLRHLKVEIAQSNLPQIVSNILKCIMQQTRCETLMQSLMEAVGGALGELSPLGRGVVPEGSAADLFCNYSQESLVTALAAVSSTVAALSNLTKSALAATQAEQRRRILKAWTEPYGQVFLSKLHTAFMVLAWQNSLVQLIHSSSKTTATTQTDPIDEDEPMSGTTQSSASTTAIESTSKSGPAEPSNAGAEVAPPRVPAWELAGVSALEHNLWLHCREVYSVLQKTYRNVEELMTLLGRVATGLTTRQRRGYEPQIQLQGPASTLAENHLLGFSRALIFNPRPELSIIYYSYLNTMLKLFFSLLFDEKQSPYLVVVEKFYSTGCHRHFFQLMVEKLAPAIAGDYKVSLDTAIMTWLQIAEQLVNKQQLVNSRHRLADDRMFPVQKYHQVVVLDLFKCLNVLFNNFVNERVDLRKNVRVCEKAIHVYKEVVHNLIVLRDASEQIATSATAADGDRAEAPADAAPAVDPVEEERQANIQMLTDMGFPRERVIRALLETRSINEATEWLVSRNNQENELDALEAVLGERFGGERNARRLIQAGRGPAPMEEGEPSASSATVDGEKIEEIVKRMDSQKPQVEKLTELKVDLSVELLDGIIARTCTEIVPLCKRLMECGGSELVYSTADLVVSVVNSADPLWKKSELIQKTLRDEVSALIEEHLSGAIAEEKTKVLAIRLHFVCLLFEPVADDYLAALTPEHLKQMMNLLNYVRNKYDSVEAVQCLLSPVLLWLDQWDKTTRLSRRRAAVKSVVGADKKLAWSFYGVDERVPIRQSVGKWTAFPAAISKKLTEALLSGQIIVSISYQKKEYTINFTDMIQRSETGHERHVIAVELADAKVPLDSILEEECTPIWKEAESDRLMEILMCLLHKQNMDTSTVHTLLFFIARLTREVKSSESFVRQGGLRAIFNLKCTTTPSTSALLALIVRNCIDDEAALTSQIEKAVRAVAQHGVPTVRSRWTNTGRHGSSVAHDWLNCTRSLAQLAARAPSIYAKALQKLVRITKGDMALVPSLPPPTPCIGLSDQGKQIVEMLLREAAHGEWEAPQGPLASHGAPRMISRGAILALIAELCRSYLGVALFVTEQKDENSSHTVLHRIITRLIRDKNDKESVTALKTLVSTIASANSSKAQEALVMDIKSAVTGLSSANLTPEQITNSLNELSTLVILMRDAGSPAPNAKPSPNSTHIVRLIHKKKICNDLVKAIPNLPLGQKEAVDTVNQVLRTLEELTKSINGLEKPDDKKKQGTESQSRIDLETLATSITDNIFHGDEDHHHNDTHAEDDRVDEVMGLLLEQVDMEFADHADHGEMQSSSDSEDTEDEDELRREREDAENLAREEDADDDGEELRDEEGNEDGMLDEELAEDSMSSMGSHDEEDGGERDDEEEDEEEEEEAEHRDDDDEVRAGRPVLEVAVEVAAEEQGNDAAHGEDSETADGQEEDSEMDEEDDAENYPHFDPFGDGFDFLREDREGLDHLFDTFDELDIMGLGGPTRQRLIGDDLPIAIHAAGVPGTSANAGNIAHQHPLLRRPPSNGSGGNTAPGQAHQYPGGLAAMRLPSRYRLVLGRNNHNFGGGLHRQGAVRRMQSLAGLGLGTLNGDFIERILDASSHAPVFGGRYDYRNGGRLFNILNDEIELTEHRPSSVMTASERIAEGSRMLDEQGSHLLALLIHTSIKEKAVEEEQKREAEEQAKKAKEEAEKAAETETAKSASSTSTALGETQQPTDRVEEMSVEATVESIAQQEEVANVSEVVQPRVSTEEPMDTQEVPPPVVNDVAMEVTPVLGPGTERESEFDVDDEDETMATPRSTVEDTPPEPANVTPAEEPSTSQVTPAEVAQEEDDGTMEVPEEFKAILGDMRIPVGVDPAFLAALPEDLRADVLRDHERQRRAARAAARPPPPQPEVAVAAPSNATDNFGVGAVDQEFLAALPPELQEEVLQQHERAVRNARAAQQQRSDNVDPVAVIESLPPAVRAQVLADADDSVLQVLPQTVADEARRLRANLEQQNVLRYARLFTPGTRPRQMAHRTGLPIGGAASSLLAQIGGFAGRTTTASPNAVQILDREGIVTLVTLFLLDQNRLNTNKLQRVLRGICSHAVSCDFVIWCLLSLLDKANESKEDDDVMSAGPTWLDSVTVSGIGHNEKVLKIGKNAETVSIHSMVASNVSRSVMDTLAMLARSYPGHFLPNALRPSKSKEESKEVPSGDLAPPLKLFWQMVHSHPSPYTKDKLKDKESEFVVSDLHSSPLGVLMLHFRKSMLASNGQLQEKLLRLLSIIVQTLPDETMAKLGLEVSVRPPLEEELKLVVEVITNGACTPEGSKEGKTLLVEAMRAFNPATADLIYNLLFNAVSSVGERLLPQINQLLTELESVVSKDTESPSSSARQSKKNTTQDRRITTNRYDGERVVLDGDANPRMVMNASGCEELQLPAVRALTDKGSCQHLLLKSLQTLTQMRDTMREMKADRRKRAEEKRKKEDAEETERIRKEFAAKTTSTPEEIEANKQALEAAEKAHEETVKAREAIIKESEKKEDDENPEVRLSERLSSLESLWAAVSKCLLRLGAASDAHAVLALQPAAEAFFLVHASSAVIPQANQVQASQQAVGTPVAAHVASSTSTSMHSDDPDTHKLIEFAEKHREVLNQVLRQNHSALSEGGPFQMLTHFPKLLDFDVKRKYFRKELTRMDDRMRAQIRRRDDVPVRVRRSHIFSDSFRELFRLRGQEWKARFYIMFEGEEGQDAGGLLREWFSVITREIFNPNYALFITAPGDRVTYMINKASYINPEHLDYFKFVGRIIAKAIYDNKLLDCYFTRAFYKHILNLPVRYQDIESEDPGFYKSLEFLLNNPVEDLGYEITFSTEVEEFGVRDIRPLKPDGEKLPVTDGNKEEYVQLVCQMKMTGSIQKQLAAFLEGFNEIIPKKLISMFNEQELELLISGLPNVDIDDLAANTEYRTYTKTSPQIQWLWRALRSFDQADRAKFLQFVTGTSKVPLQGFASLEGMNGVQRFSVHADSRSGDRLPTAHTCFNQLDLPQYESYEKLRDMLLIAIRECSEGFGFA